MREYGEDGLCREHSGLQTRVDRNEQDIQTLFSKVGESIGLLHRIDKRLEAFHAKIAGVAAAVTLGVSLLLKLVPWEDLLKP